MRKRRLGVLLVPKRGTPGGLALSFQSVVVKSLERNVANLYEARRLLLRLGACENDVTVKTACDTPPPANGLTAYWLSLLMQQLRLSDPGIARTYTVCLNKSF